MWLFFRHLIQLLLAPSRGWEDVSASGINFDNIIRRGYLPLVGITAMSEFIPLFYSHELTVLSAIGNAIAIGGGLFASVYAARLFLEVVVPRVINANVNVVKIDNVAVYLLGLDCLYMIFSNLIPAVLTFMLFLPLISIVVIFRSATYIGIEEDKIINYLFIAFTGVVILPALICWLLMLII